MMKRLILTAILCASALTAQASTVTIGTDQGLVRAGMDNQGWWRSDIVNQISTSLNDNYVVGNGYRNYFSFDLSGLSGIVITGLTLELRRYGLPVPVTYSLWDVSTNATLLARRGILDQQLYADLGTGNSYGTFDVLPTVYQNSTDIVSFELNANAVADANAALGGYFSIGGTNDDVSTLFGVSTGEQGNGGPGYTQQLVINYQALPTVPVPASAPLMVAGLGGLLALRRRKAKA